LSATSAAEVIADALDRADRKLKARFRGLTPEQELMTYKSLVAEELSRLDFLRYRTSEEYKRITDAVVNDLRPSPVGPSPRLKLTGTADAMVANAVDQTRYLSSLPQNKWTLELFDRVTEKWKPKRAAKKKEKTEAEGGNGSAR